MIELEKRDIVAIAERRYQKAHGKRFIVLIAGFLIGLLAAIATLNTAHMAVQLAVFAVVAGAILYGLYRYTRGIDNYAKEFIAQVEADPELRYEKPEIAQNR